MNFSVVIPCYNKVALIGDTLESVLAQTAAPHEVIVVDDGSTDGSGSLISRAFPSITLIRQTNQGVAAARNRGIHEARSAWISFLDADDVWLPNHIAETRRIIETFPEAGLVSTAHRQVRGPVTHALSRPIAPGTPRLTRYLTEAVANWGAVWTSAATVRRDLIIRSGGFGPFVTGEDIELWVRLSFLSPIAVSDNVTALYRRGVGGVIETRDTPDQTLRSPSRLQDLQPCCRPLLQELESLDAPESPAAREIKSFLGFLVEMYARQAFVRGDFPAFRQIYSLRPEGAPVHSRTLSLLALAPLHFLSIGHHLYRFRKHYLQR